MEALQHQMRERGVEVSQSGAAGFYAELRDAGVVEFAGWDGEGEPEFDVTPMGEEIFCPKCATVAAGASDHHIVKSTAVLQCSECGTSWYANASAIDALRAFGNAKHRLVGEEPPATLPSPHTPDTE
jgi:hypothetical protein